MKKEVFISFIALHIINAVKKARLELGLSQRDVSKILSPDSSSNLLGGIESSQRPDKYTDDHLNKIAKVFTLMAQKIQKEFDSEPGNTTKIKTEYTIFDFYPPEPLPDGEQIKEIETQPKDLKTTGILNLLLESDDPFIKEWHTIREITEYCSNLMNRSWKSTDFTAIIDRAEKRGYMIKSEDNGVRYKKA